MMLKVKIYKYAIRPVLLYGLEVMALRRVEERALMSTEIRMLRWMIGLSLWEHRTNEDIRKFTKVSNVREKTRELMER